MNKEEFKEHAERLVDCFPRFYNKARMKLLWFEVNRLHVNHWINIVDECIGNHRTPPTVSDIRKYVTQVREQAARKEDEIIKQNATDFFDPCIDDEEKIWRARVIRRKLLRDIPDHFWSLFMDYLNVQASVYDSRSSEDL